MGRSKRSLIACGILSLVAACSPPPPPEEPVLTADPPAGGAEGLSASAANTELQRAIEYLKNQKPEDAKKHLEAALAEKPEHAEANYYMGLTSEMLGDKKGAEGFYKKAIASDPALVRASVDLAAMYLEDPARPDEAIAVLTKALEKAPDDAKLNQNLGFAYGLKKEHAKAAKAYETAIAKEDSAQLRFAYGALLFDANDMPKAAEQLGKALAGTKDDVPMLVTLGRMLGKAGAYADCVRAFDAALAAKTDAEWLVRRGTCKHGLKDEAGARQDFEAATKADPKFAAAFYYLGMSYKEDLKKHKADAIAALEKAAKLGEGTEIGKNAAEKLKEVKKSKP